LFVAAVVAAGGITVAIDVIAVLAGGHPLIWPQRQMTVRLLAARWDDDETLAIGAAIALLGLLLLAAGLTPGRRRLVPLAGDDPHLTVGATSSGIRNAIANSAREVDGVHSVRVGVGSRRISVQARCTLRDVGGLEDALRSAVEECLEGIAPIRRPKVRVRAVPRREG
jgi:hypothetical protein